MSTGARDLYVVLGGGIAGVCCAQELARIHQNNAAVRIILVTATEVLKESVGVMKITEHLEELTIYEKKVESFKLEHPNIEIVFGEADSIDSTNKVLILKDRQIIKYGKLCVCTGAQPKLVALHPNVIGLRDLESIVELTKRLSNANKIVVVGNGGIAVELVHMLTFCHIEWIVKDHFVGSAFFDASSSAFIMPTLLERARKGQAVHVDPVSLLGIPPAKTLIPPSGVPAPMHVQGEVRASSLSSSNTVRAASPAQLQKHHGSSERRQQVSVGASGDPGVQGRMQGSALGPEWATKSQLLLELPEEVKGADGSLQIHFGQEVRALRDGVYGLWHPVYHGDGYVMDHPELPDLTSISRANEHQHQQAGATTTSAAGAAGAAHSASSGWGRVSPASELLERVGVLKGGQHSSTAGKGSSCHSSGKSATTTVHCSTGRSGGGGGGGDGGGGGGSRGVSPRSDAEAADIQYPLYVLTSAGKVIGCDFVISATGVVPTLSFAGPEFDKEDISSFFVETMFQSTIITNSDRTRKTPSTPTREQQQQQQNKASSRESRSRSSNLQGSGTPGTPVTVTGCQRRASATRKSLKMSSGKAMKTNNSSSRLVLNTSADRLPSFSGESGGGDFNVGGGADSLMIVSAGVMEMPDTVSDDGGGGFYSSASDTDLSDDDDNSSYFHDECDDGDDDDDDDDDDNENNDDNDDVERKDNDNDSQSCQADSQHWHRVKSAQKLAAIPKKMKRSSIIRLLLQGDDDLKSEDEADLIDGVSAHQKRPPLVPKLHPHLEGLLLSRSSSQRQSPRDRPKGSGSLDTRSLVVDEYMQTSVRDVFAAGDCCCYRPKEQSDIIAGKQWFQMRLWTQARTMGIYAAQCMSGQQEELGGEFAFELFTHVTRFFGHKVVLLGRYNAQGMGSKLEAALKTMVVTKDGLIQRAGSFEKCNGRSIIFDPEQHQQRSNGSSSLAESLSPESAAESFWREKDPSPQQKTSFFTSSSSSSSSSYSAIAGASSAATAVAAVTATATTSAQGASFESSLSLSASSSESSAPPSISPLASPVEENRQQNQQDYQVAAAAHTDIEIWTRVVPDVEYVKLVVYRGKVVGALLIGDTNLEEVFENLILNRLDVSHLGVEMLDPAIDLEDYFD